jgi:lipoxygenase homology domain-containing protein 1
MSSIDEDSRGSTEEGIPYTVKVKTGEASDAGTAANVFIRLIGHKGQKTNMIPLELKQRRRFESGKVETFSLQEPDIGDLEVVEIEHDGDTLADSWFLDDVTIEMPTKGRVFYFVCREWLSKHKGDGRTKRILKVQESNQTSFRPCKICFH